MTSRLGIGLIGLGSIGQRMLRNADVHERVRPVAAWDPDATKMNTVLSAFTGVEHAGSAADVIQHDDVDLVYVASPPATHADHAHRALDAAKPVLCEKPLGIDLAASRGLVEHAARSGVPNAVNFIYASGVGTRLEAAVESNAIGSVVCAVLTIHARRWAERRYAEAPWLAHAGQGGFVREVVSHFVYLSERLFGPARVRYARVRATGASDDAETQVFAELDCGGVPVCIVGGTEGAGPDAFEYTIWGERGSRSAVDLYQLRASDGGPWQPCAPSVPDPAAEWFRQQLDNVANWAAGQPHTMPDFDAALSVQRVIEEMVRR